VLKNIVDLIVEEGHEALAGKAAYPCGDSSYKHSFVERKSTIKLNRAFLKNRNHLMKDQSV
jgi:hypothetical protein